MRQIILAALAALSIATLTTAAEARPRQHHPAGWIDVAAIPAYPMERSYRQNNASRTASHRVKQPRMRLDAQPAEISHQRASLQVDKPQERSVCRNNRGSTSLARVVEPLKSKAQEIVRECGAHIVSTDCRGGATPNHRLGLAVDIAMRGRANPTCIYAHLKNWPGGVSTDYWTAPGTKHVHFSYNRQHEWGLRFSHSRSLYGAVSKFKKQRVARLR